jgi:hypothetical protein
LFLGANKRYIALMLADNALKIIPLVKNPQTKVQLSAAFNVRIRHPEINQIFPMFGNSDQHLGIFIMHKVYGARGEV